MTELVLWLAQTHPNVATYLVAVGILRQVFKPAFMLLQKLAESTETKKDDHIISTVQHSWLYQATSFILDHTASIKLDQVVPQKKLQGESEKH